MWIVLTAAWCIAALSLMRDSLRIFGWSAPWLPAFSTTLIVWTLVAGLLGLPAAATAAVALPVAVLVYAGERRRHAPGTGRMFDRDKACRLLFKAGDLVGLGSHLRSRLGPSLTRTAEATAKPVSTRGLDDIGLESELAGDLRGILERPNGLFVICGPEGCGKTTTAYAGLHDLDFSARRILTVENHIERLLPGAWQREANRAAGLQLFDAVEASLRLDPDVLFVDDVADARTAAIIVQESLAGRLVMATLSAHDAAAAFDRLIALGVAPRQLQAALIAIFAQRLVRRLCSGCRLPARLPAAVRSRLRIPAADRAFVFEASPAGCDACDSSGHDAILPIGELLMISGRLRESLNWGLKTAAIREVARQEGARLLGDEVVLRVLRGDIGWAEARSAVR
jgi:type II secretory ATPase GspE/PulE/Tfp pilus assembly ATPase PilB-like protein